MIRTDAIHAFAARRPSTIRTESQDHAHWLYMHADAATAAAPVRPCFRPELMEDMHGWLDGLVKRSEQALAPMQHLVLASDTNAFNLGGDLAVFAELIRQRDPAGLLHYARSCVEGVYRFHRGLNGNFRTIALVQGDALGGGLEMALSCHTIVAEEGSGMGLPEVLFGLFPGMGAYNFLARRVSAQQAEKMILEGRIYSAEEMHALGVVDVLVPRGEGPAAVAELIRQQQRIPHACLAMNRVRGISHAVSYQELMDITQVWVDTALQLDEKSLRTMDRLVKAQLRRSQQG